MAFKRDDVIVTVPVLFKRSSPEKYKWFLTKRSADGDWELPHAFAKKGESSVRAAMRTLSEQAGIDAKVFEEVGRSRTVASSAGKPVVQRHLYYLVQYLGGGEILEFAEVDWVPYANAVRRLKQKRDQDILREARKLLREIEKDDKRFNIEQ